MGLVATARAHHLEDDELYPHRAEVDGPEYLKLRTFDVKEEDFYRRDAMLCKNAGERSKRKHSPIRFQPL
eukprot:CAMPEP_0115846822 /NCGR_PEP_ID=MMETSP0287-20121206/10059_1 /TAXON_ID=412157 /ORGANISM="Chrysochromulina rotalis, Strain UIO044" /LENGTH=69 /DNA_ID=CAMNT_0003300625 /DNA_START=546 /DNA_END=755 /DNA_ORIENTATION=+